MSDVFISYASSDRAKAQLLADVLASRGYSVWWDRTIPPGRYFDDVIQEAINAAKCVIVLWSRASVASNWVKTEATEAAARNILVPVFIEDVPLPIGFKRIQAADLTAWDGAVEHAYLKVLLGAVEQLVRRGPAEIVQPRVGPSGPRSQQAADGLSNAGATAKAGRKTGIPTFVAIGTTVVAGIAFLTYLQRPESEPQPRQTSKTGAQGPAKDATSRADTSHGSSKSDGSGSASASSAASSAGTAQQGRINLLAPENGGQLVVATDRDWVAAIDGKASSKYVSGEGVFAFKGEQPAVFDTFTVLIPSTSAYNLGKFQLLAAMDSPTGTFDEIGTFTTQNVRFHQAPYQQFSFEPVKARYLKVRVLSRHDGRERQHANIYEFQLFGSLVGK